MQKNILKIQKKYLKKLKKIKKIVNPKIYYVQFFSGLRNMESISYQYFYNNNIKIYGTLIMDSNIFARNFNYFFLNEEEILNPETTARTNGENGVTNSDSDHQLIPDQDSPTENDSPQNSLYRGISLLAKELWEFIYTSKLTFIFTCTLFITAIIQIFISKKALEKLWFDPKSPSWTAITYAFIQNLESIPNFAASLLVMYVLGYFLECRIDWKKMLIVMVSGCMFGALGHHIHQSLHLRGFSAITYSLAGAYFLCCLKDICNKPVAAERNRTALTPPLNIIEYPLLGIAILGIALACEVVEFINTENEKISHWSHIYGFGGGFCTCLLIDFIC